MTHRLLSSLDMRALLFVTSLVLVSCGMTTTFTPLNPHPYGNRARPLSSVALVTTKPERPYTELGIIKVGEESVYSQADAHATTTYASGAVCDTVETLSALLTVEMAAGIARNDLTQKN